MNMQFIDYVINDSNIVLHFVSSNPSAGQPSDYYIEILDSDLASFTTVQAFGTFIITKLKRKIQANGIASVLDQFKGRSVTI